MSAFESLQPKQFMKQHIPGEYSHTWRGVASNSEFLKGQPIGELIDDVEQHGVLNPVTVSRGVVVDGHHRVIAAAVSGQPVPFTESDTPDEYADQVRIAKNANISGNSGLMPSTGRVDRANVPEKLRRYLGWKS